MTETRVQVLCLHGCNQTEEMFRSILKNMMKIGVKSHNLEFHFIQAEYPHSNGGWTWYSKELQVADIPGGIAHSEELVADCMERIDNYVRDHGITVLLGFSQGGNVVDTYLSSTSDSPIERAVILSGYELVQDEREPVETPLLSIYSDKDDVVPSSCRPTNYATLHEYHHEKGHKFPTGNPLLRKFCKFIEDGTWD